MGVAAYACAAMVLRATGSKAGALLCAGLLALNPNILYLQSTPMTEPLLIALLMVVAMAMHAWASVGHTWLAARGRMVAGGGVPDPLRGVAVHRLQRWPSPRWPAGEPVSRCERWRAEWCGSRCTRSRPWFCSC